MIVFILSTTLAFAAQTATPSVDDPATPVDAEVALITGNSVAGAKIQVTGGPQQLSPVYADDDGDFEITVGLAQESENSFFITAEIDGEDKSEAIQVLIVEGEEAAQAYEEESGEDLTAPDQPEVDHDSIETDKLSYTIEGTGEEDTTVLINGEDSGVTVDSDGTFEIEVDLTGNGVEDTFDIRLQDDAGNISSKVRVEIESGTENDEDEEEEEEEEEEEDEDDNDFSDTRGHWGHGHIQRLRALGIVSGHDGTNEFRPNHSIGRDAILKMAIEAFYDDDEIDTDEGDDLFGDVPRGSWFRHYVRIGERDDIIDGESDGKYHPERNVTRAAALKIILRTAKISIITGGNGDFADVPTDAWFAGYVDWAKENGVVGGYDDGLFHGEREMTRAEVSKIIALVLDYLEEQE